MITTEHSLRKTTITINNRIYKIKYFVYIGVDGKERLFIENIWIEAEFRRKGYARRIIQNLHRKYELPIHLYCFTNLLKFYRKLGFRKIYGPGFDELCEMKLNFKKPKTNEKRS